LNNTIEANSKASVLVVKGIPMLSKENTVLIYKKIATAIGYSDERTPSVEAFRLGRKRPESKYDPPILLRFTYTIDKNAFHIKYFVHKKLNLSDVGFQSNERIYINENLIKDYQPIYQAAMKLRFEKKLHTVTTSHGIVHVKQTSTDRSIPIKMINELDRF
jgi:hypothetical protein